MAKDQRSYTAEDKGAALFGLDLNGGFVRPTAQALNIPHATLDRWGKDENPATEAAKAAISETKNVSELAAMFLELARAAITHSMANLDKASPYHAALIGAISLDKWALITGRPTSRTEVLKARYVEPESLRAIASHVIVDVPAKARETA